MSDRFYCVNTIVWTRIRYSKSDGFFCRFFQIIMIVLDIFTRMSSTLTGAARVIFSSPSRRNYLPPRPYKRTDKRSIFYFFNIIFTTLMLFYTVGP